MNTVLNFYHNVTNPILKVCSYVKNAIEQIQGIKNVKNYVFNGTINWWQLFFGLWYVSIQKPWTFRQSLNNKTSVVFPPHKILEAYRAMCYAAALYGTQIFLLALGYFDAIIFRILSLMFLPLVFLADPLQLLFKNFMIEKFVPWFMNDLKIRLFEGSLTDQSKQYVTYKSHNNNSALPSAAIYIDQRWPENNDVGYIHALVIGIRGSSDISDWLCDFNAEIKNTERFCDDHSLPRDTFGKVHTGMWEATVKIYYNNIESIQNILTQDRQIKKIIITGHSLGGGVTIYLSKILNVLLPNQLKNIPIPIIEGYAFAPPTTIDYHHVNKYSHNNDKNDYFLWSFVYGIDLVPRFSLGSVRELINRSSQVYHHSRPSWNSFIFYSMLEIYWWFHWLLTGNYDGITNRFHKAFPKTDEDYFDKCQFQSTDGKYMEDTLLVPSPVYLLWNNENRPLKGHMEAINPEKHLSTIFWSPLQALFSHSPFHYIKCLNDLRYQYQEKNKKKDAQLNLHNDNIICYNNNNNNNNKDDIDNNYDVKNDDRW